MNIEIKRSVNTVNYDKAILFLEDRVNSIIENRDNELIWVLTHPKIYTAGTSYKESEILDKSIKIVKSNRGGKITYHGPGQLVCYFVINLNKRSKDIRKFIKLIENTIIETLKEYKINSFNDRKNIGVWVKHRNKSKKIAAIGVKVRRWIAYHGFSININVDVKNYKKIIPCGIKNKTIGNLYDIKKQNYNKLKEKIIKNLIKNLKN